MPLARTRQLAGHVIDRFHRHQTFVWFWAPLERQLHPLLPDGLSLTRGTAADLPLLAELGADFERAAEFLAAGHRFWLLRDGDRVAFASWAFLGPAPTDAVRTGWIELPVGTHNREDSTTHPDFRGRGYLDLAGTLIRGELAREGWLRQVSAVRVDNTSSLRAVAKGPSRPFAVVDVRKMGLLRPDSQWRNRRPDPLLTVTRVRVSQPAVPGGPTPVEEELLGWLRKALRAGVRGPGSPAAASPAVAERAL